MANRQYIEDRKGQAYRMAKGAGIYASVVMAQMIKETGYGGSDLSRNHRNQAGISYTGAPGSYSADGRHAGYYTESAFEADYVRVMRLSFYDHIRAAAAEGQNPYQVALLFDQGSPRYAEDEEYGAGLVRVMQANELVELMDGETVYQVGPVSVAVGAGGAGVNLSGLGGALPWYVAALGVLAVLAAREGVKDAKG